MKTFGQILLLVLIIACQSNELCWSQLDKLKDEQYVLNNHTKTSFQNRIKMNNELLAKIKELKNSYSCSDEFKEKYRYSCDKLIIKGEEYLNRINNNEQ